MTTPPISRIAMSNFKSVKSADVRLSPLTVIVGRNSAGKSSLLQALLLLSMNASFDDGSTFRLNGRPLKLGEFTDVLHDAAKSPGIPGHDYGHVAQQSVRLGVSTTISHKPRPQFRRAAQKRTPQVLPEVVNTHTDISFTLEASGTEPGAANLANVSVTIDRGDLGAVSFDVAPSLLSKSTQETESAHFDDETPSAHSHRVTVRGTLPNWDTSVGVKRTEKLDRWRDVQLTVGQALAFSDLLEGHRVLMEALELDRDYEIETVFLRRVRQRDGEPNSENLEQLDIASIPKQFSARLQSLPSAAEVGYEPLFAELRLALLALTDVLKLRDPEMLTADAVRRALPRLWEAVLTHVVRDYTSIREPNQLINAYASTLTMPGKVRDVIREFRAQLLNADLHPNSISGILDFVPNVPTDLGPSFSHRLARLMDGPGVIGLIQPRASSLLERKIRYLGPLRMEAQFSYSAAGEPSEQAPLGVRGEGAIEALRPDARTSENFVLPPGHRPPPGRRAMRLVDAVTLWVAYLTNKHTPVRVGPLTAYGRTATFGSHKFPHVGTGASQLLPIMALCLEAAAGEVILLEQPELHLHPSLQQMLTEFLLTMVEHGRQIIIETHSEYIITRLRRIAVTEPDRREMFGILFAENEGDQGTTYRNVQISPDGGIEDWPRGFFEEVSNDLEVIMRANMRQEDR